MPARPTGGFSIVELLVTVVIVAVLASAALPMAELVRQRSKEQDLRRGLREIRSALDAYKLAADEGRIAKAGTSGYPRSLDVLAEGMPDIKNPKNGQIYFLRRIPRDPFAPAGVPPSEGWGKRSYQSPPHRPREGADVYDVYSLATGVGLNRIPYREW